MAKHNEMGRLAEEMACEHLKKEGLKLVARNYRSPFGEIDLIMSHKEGLVFVEVRYRSSETFGSASATINTKKQQRLVATAEHYLQKTCLIDTPPCRFDVVTFSGQVDKNSISWIRNALGTE